MLSGIAFGLDTRASAEVAIAGSAQHLAELLLFGVVAVERQDPSVVVLPTVEPRLHLVYAHLTQVAHHDIGPTGGELLARDVSRDPEHHAEVAALPGRHSRDGVFHHQRLRRLEAEVLGSHDEDVGIRFAAEPELRGDYAAHPGLEQAFEAGLLEHELSVLAGGSHPDPNAAPLELFDERNARLEHRRAVSFQKLLVQSVLLVAQTADREPIRRVGRVSHFQVRDPTRIEEGLGTLVAGLAVHVGEVVLIGEFLEGLTAFGRPVLEVLVEHRLPRRAVHVR